MDALVVIDVQQGMWAFPEYPPHDGEGMVGRICGLIDRARAAGAPVFFVQHEGGPGEALEPGKPGFALHADLRPRPDEPVIAKRQCSAFLDTDLDARLKSAGADRLVICGMQTEFCVDTAVRGAVERGYKVTLVADGHSTGDTRVLKAADIIRHHNNTLRMGFAEVKPAAEIAFG
ncbi:cysteine hydrolase family protein [Phenylobacterium sp.]|jgi:nicotinamidase-related amidase|uniref:cysteine hydrolase family protein n=1 Tax=Phenylobacterium sp. TaxID=1871053 RepID=UPI002E302594|nr:cysteine hydrolase family protein [Phenylobacterium sp.]HEX2559804.1 cysteine hydrolase family protein [Phenylobacterium sp.]